LRLLPEPKPHRAAELGHRYGSVTTAVSTPSRTVTEQATKQTRSAAHQPATAATAARPGCNGALTMTSPAHDECWPDRMGLRCEPPLAVHFRNPATAHVQAS